MRYIFLVQLYDVHEYAAASDFRLADTKPPFLILLPLPSSTTIVYVNLDSKTHQQIQRGQTSFRSNRCTTHLSRDLEGRYRIFFFINSILKFFHSSFYIMSLERKSDASRPSHLCDVHISEITEGLPATPVTSTAEALERLTINHKTTPSAHRESFTLILDFESFVDDLRPLRAYLVRLLERSDGKQRPKIALSPKYSGAKLWEDTVRGRASYPRKSSVWCRSVPPQSSRIHSWSVWTFTLVASCLLTIDELSLRSSCHIAA